MNIRFLLWLNILLAISGSAYSQTKIERLKPGDRLPDTELSMVRNDKIEKVNFSNYKGKKIIIDLWNRWCTVCIDNFPKIAKLKDEYQHDLVVLAISNDSFDEFKKLRTKSRNVRESALPFVVNDTVFRKLIQTTVMPTYVWINEDMTINAITRSHGMNDGNVKKFMKGEKLDFDLVGALKKGKEEMKLAKMDAPRKWNHITYFSGFERVHEKSTYPVYGRATEDRATGKVGVDNLQVPFLYLYSMAYDIRDLWDIITTNDKLQYAMYPIHEKYLEKWYLNTTCSYQIVLDDSAAIHINKIMQKDLQEYLGISAEVKDTLREILMLEKSEGFTGIGAKDPQSVFEEKARDSLVMKGGNVGSMIAYLSEAILEKEQGGRPIFDYTGITYPIDIFIELKDDMRLAEINKSLKNLGLRLVAGKASRKTLILR